MPTKSWRKSVSVVDRILQNPQDFSFFQLVRLLERAGAFLSCEPNMGADAKIAKLESNPVARFTPPSTEIIRFKNNSDLSFPGSAVVDLSKNTDNEHHQWVIKVNFIGLTGAMGVLPFHYSELMLQRLRLKDPSMEKYLNLFNHRTTSLFYQAATKYNLPIEYERSRLRKRSSERESMHTKALLSIVGLGTDKLRNRQFIPDESFIFYSGLLTQQVKTSSGLKQIIQDYFDVPAEIQGFVGQWQDLIDDVRTRLPSRKNRMGQNVCLGRSSMLGSKGWFAQGKSRIKIGPLNKEQFYRFAPGTKALKALNQLVSSYVGMEQDFDFVIQVKREDIPSKIALRKDNPPLVAWNTWLSGKPKTDSDKDELLEISVTSNRLN